MTTKAVADWLAATVSADLALTCAKGFAAWDRPAIANSAFVEWQSNAPGEQLRISSTQDTFTATFQLVVMTASEPALWAMVDSLQAMTKTVSEASISGNRYRVRWTAITRAEQQGQTVEALRYAAVTTVQITR